MPHINMAPTSPAWIGNRGQDLYEVLREDFGLLVNSIDIQQSAVNMTEVTFRCWYDESSIVKHPPPPTAYRNAEVHP